MLWGILKLSLGQDSAWMVDSLRTHGAAGTGADSDAAKRPLESWLPH